MVCRFFTASQVNVVLSNAGYVLRLWYALIARLLRTSYFFRVFFLLFFFRTFENFFVTSFILQLAWYPKLNWGMPSHFSCFIPPWCFHLLWHIERAAFFKNLLLVIIWITFMISAMDLTCLPIMKSMRLESESGTLFHTVTHRQQPPENVPWCRWLTHLATLTKDGSL